MGWKWCGHKGATQSAMRILDCRGLLSPPCTAHSHHQSTALPALLTRTQPNSSADFFWSCFTQFGTSRGFKKTGQKHIVPRCKRCDIIHGERSWISLLQLLHKRDIREKRAPAWAGESDPSEQLIPSQIHNLQSLEQARLLQIFLVRGFPSLEHKTKKEGNPLPYSQMIY